MFNLYIIKPHAKERMKERGIKEEVVKGSLRKPTKILYDNKNRILIKKLYEKDGKIRLLLIAGEIKNNYFEIITVIDTSKVKKYI